MAAAQTAPPSLPVAPIAAPGRASAVCRTAGALPVIRFEDASDKAGINFTHSFGSRQLGSLLEGTGAGCIWFDYNNSGLPVSLCGQRAAARRLDASLSAEGEAGNRRRTIISIATTATAHFTDVTEKSGLNPDMYSDGRDGGRL